MIMNNFDLTVIERETMMIFINLRHKDEPELIGAQELANIFKVSRARTHAILSKLEDKNILQKFKRKGFILTNYGISMLNEFEHRLKIIETFCVNELKMDINKAEKEASKLVLHVSFEFIEALCDKLEKPIFCPHNLKIPHHKEHGIK